MSTQTASSQQNTLPLNLETVLELCGANNLGIRQYRQQQTLAEADLARAREWWLPDLSAGAQTHLLSGAVMNGNGRFFLDVQRDNFRAGTALDARWDFNKSIFETKSARLKAQAAQFATQAGRNRAILESIKAYYDFLTAQLTYAAFEQLAAQADTLARQLDVQVRAGRGYQSEWLLAKSNLNHWKVQMLSAKSEQAARSAALVKLLNLDPATQLLSTDTLLRPLDFWKEQPGAAYFENARQNRPEFKAILLNLSALEAERKTATSGLLLPELRLGASGAYFGDLDGPVQPIDPVAYPTTRALYPTGMLDVSLQWRIPLGRLAYAGDLKQREAKIALQQTHLEQMKAEANEEIIAARERLRLAGEQMELAGEGSRLAFEALQQCLRRQELGTARAFEVLQAQEAYLKSRLDYLRAVSAYNVEQYRMYVATGNNL